MDNALFQEAYNHPLIRSSDYEEIMSAHVQVSFKRGDVLLKVGETANCYYLIEAGLIRNYVHSVDGDEVTTRFYSVNEFSIVILSFFQRIPSVENVVAVTDVKAWKIDFDSFQGVMRSIKGFGIWGRDWMSGQLFILEQRLIDVLTKAATERYLELMRERPEVLQYASLKHIASYLGITDTSLSRIRKEVSKK